MSVKRQLTQIISLIIEKGVETLHFNKINEKITIDYVAMFAKTDEEFEEFNSLLKTLGNKLLTGLATTGETYKFKDSLATSYGMLSYIKIRKPDPVRPQRGAPDFIVKNYEEFKNKYIRSSGNFTLMLRKGYEMIEIKGIDVYVYIPSIPIFKRLG